jgi:conjugal transfer pilus assembly protein TraF
MRHNRSLKILLICLFIQMSVISPAHSAEDTKETAASDPADVEITEAFTGPVYFDRRQEGWFWHREFKRPIRPQKSIIPKKLPPTMKEMREQAEALLNRAIEEPTKENVHAYLAYQQLIFDRTEKFARAWQHVLWEHPELDPTVENPTVTAGISVARAEQTRRRDERLLDLAQNAGLLYFFSGNCPLCEVQSPILASFASTYGFQVIPISVDGSEDPLFTPARVDRGAAERLGVSQAPALFLATPATGEVRRIGTGLLSMEDLMMRLAHLTEDSREEKEIEDEDLDHEETVGADHPLGRPLPADGPGRSSGGAR